MLPHRHSLSDHGRGVSVLTFTSMNEAWVSCLRHAQSEVGIDRYPQGPGPVAACAQAYSFGWIRPGGERRVKR